MSEKNQYYFWIKRKFRPWTSDGVSAQNLENGSGKCIKYYYRTTITAVVS